jgi:hypothetical protein
MARESCKLDFQKEYQCVRFKVRNRRLLGGGGGTVRPVQGEEPFGLVMCSQCLAMCLVPKVIDLIGSLTFILAGCGVRRQRYG